MTERIENVITELEAVAEAARVSFGGLSAEQLNRKPSEKEWSAAQCFDHVIVTHGLYFPLLERFATGEVLPTFWERMSPFSGFFGRYLLRSLDPKSTKKVKTAKKAFPSASEIDGGIIDRFYEHQQQLAARLREIPADIDPKKAIITSPLMPLVTYSLDDTFSMFVVHCQRHFDQAVRAAEI